MAADYSRLGLNNRLQSLNSLAVKEPEKIQGINFDSLYEIQGRNIKTSQANFGTIVFVSGTVSVTGTVTNGTHVVVTTTISPVSPFTNNTIGGWASEEIYEGTSVVAGSLIFPSPGGGIAADRWRFSSGYRQLGGAETNHRFQVMVYNNSGATGTIFAVARWKYLQNGGGTAE